MKMDHRFDTIHRPLSPVDDSRNVALSLTVQACPTILGRCPRGAARPTRRPQHTLFRPTPIIKPGFLVRSVQEFRSARRTRFVGTAAEGAAMPSRA